MDESQCDRLSHVSTPSSLAPSTSTKRSAPTDAIGIVSKRFKEQQHGDDGPPADDKPDKQFQLAPSNVTLFPKWTPVS